MQRNQGILTDTVRKRTHNIHMKLRTAAFSVLVTLKPCLAAYRHFRMVIAVEAGHIKGEYKGQMLSATCLDAQSELVVLAFAICSIENQVNCTWFLRNLKVQRRTLSENNMVALYRRKGLI